MRKLRKKGKVEEKKSKKIKYGPVDLKIKVQGRIGKNKILNGNKLICFKTCSVNFDGRKSKGAYKNLYWDFGNGEKYIGENPKSIKYKDFGNYKVLLNAEDFKGKKYEEVFEINFLKSKEIENKKVDTNKKINNIDKEENTKSELGIDDLIFIFSIISMIFSGSFFLLRRNKII